MKVIARKDESSWFSQFSTVVEFCPHHMEWSRHCQLAKVKKEKCGFILIFFAFFLFRASTCLQSTLSCTISCAGQPKPATPSRWAATTVLSRPIRGAQDPPPSVATSASPLRISSAPWRRWVLSTHQPAHTQPLSQGGGNKTTMSKVPIIYLFFFKVAGKAAYGTQQCETSLGDYRCKCRFRLWCHSW